MNALLIHFALSIKRRYLHDAALIMFLVPQFVPPTLEELTQEIDEVTVLVKREAQLNREVRRCPCDAPPLVKVDLLAPALKPCRLHHHIYLPCLGFNKPAQCTQAPGGQALCSPPPATTATAHRAYPASASSARLFYWHFHQLICICILVYKLLQFCSFFNNITRRQCQCYRL